MFPPFFTVFPSARDQSFDLLMFKKWRRSGGIRKEYCLQSRVPNIMATISLFTPAHRRLSFLASQIDNRAKIVGVWLLSFLEEHA